MRLKIKLTQNTTPVPIISQHLLNGYVHKCLGANNIYHDGPSDYCVSGLQGGKLNIVEQTLSFEHGGYFTVSCLDSVFIGKILMGVLNNTDFGYGMVFAGIDHINESFYNGWNHFATLSPFLIKKYTDKNEYKFATLKDVDFSTFVKNYLVTKLSKINNQLDLTDFDVSIPEHVDHKIKKIMVKNVINHANQCHISIHSNDVVAELLYNIGIGQSTGSGFGTIYKTENKHLYK